MSEGVGSDVRIDSLGQGVYRVSDAHGSRLAYAAGPPAARWVFMNGRTWLIEDPAERRSSRPDEDALSAPMPATVVRVLVAPEQHVVQGETMVVLEAMKMELAIAAPHDGIVRAVLCQPGELVQPGSPLVEMQ